MIKDTCLQQVGALPPQTLDHILEVGIRLTFYSHFLLARTNRKEKHTKIIRNSTPDILKILHKAN